jgi:L-alanine-DL-glutamate epimerase-like enolase superfamily enzyme
MSNTPFKFLDSYTKEDKDIFFGRESEVEEIYTKIFQRKILLVYGASGTGKSSLISCGLANKFQDTDWLPVNVRRGLEISDSLRQQLEKKIFTPLPSSGKVSIPKTLKSVYLDHFKPIFLIFDQFEELFIFGDRDEWMKFVSIVREVIDSDLQVRFVFIIRGEYLEYLTDFEPILPEIFGNRIRIEKMTRTNAVSCIVGPCQSFGIEVEQHFPEDLLTKLSPNKAEIELTYLQVFLDRIFKKSLEKSVDKKIVFSNTLLNELGNIGDVLSQFLDEQIELMSNSEQALAVLKAFVSTDATKKQISTQQAAEFVKNGVRIIKIKLGKNAVADVERVRRIREAAGDAIGLRIDANQGWDKETAMEILQALARYNIQYCEEPIPRWNYMDLSKVKMQSPIPIMADESCCDHNDAKRLVDLSSCDLFNVKLGKSSGIFKAQKIIQIAEQAGINIQVGGFLESRLGFTAAAHLALTSPNIIYCDFDTPLMFVEDPVVGGITYDKKGVVTVPDTPGLGATIDYNYLQRQIKTVIR